MPVEKHTMRLSRSIMQSGVDLAVWAVLLCLHAKGLGLERQALLIRWIGPMEFLTSRRTNLH